MGILKGYVSEPHSHRPVRSLPGSKANILINHRSQACLADFSLLTMVSDQSTVISSRIEGGSIPWMGPELLDPGKFGLSESRPTKESDCYALGMVVYEVLSGGKPFAPNTSVVIMRMVLEGSRPGRPQKEEGRLFTGMIWAVLERCWEPRPSDRTSVGVVLQALEGTLPPPDPQTVARPQQGGLKNWLRMKWLKMKKWLRMKWLKMKKWLKKTFCWCC